MTEESSKNIVNDGISIPFTYDVEAFRSALNYKPRSDDIFLCVYPKSGTTWAQVILYTLMHNGEAFDDNISEYFACTPFIDEIGEQGINNMHRPYVIKTHLSFARIPCDEKAKYVCVIRNPKDVCVSYYYFLIKILNQEPSKASFDAFFEQFINGGTHFGNYFEHLKGVWQHKDKANVFLTSYEEMKHDLRAVIGRLASFLNIELNDNLIERVITYSSFNYMKERFKKTYATEAQVELDDKSPTASHPVSKKHLMMCAKFDLVRKGTVGGWSSTMNEEQSQLLDKIFLEKTKDMSGLDKLFSPQ